MIVGSGRPGPRPAPAPPSRPGAAAATRGSPGIAPARAGSCCRGAAACPGRPARPPPPSGGPGVPASAGGGGRRRSSAARAGVPTDTRPFRSPTFTTLIGAEIHPRTDMMELGNVWHFVAAGLPLDFAPPDLTETGPELARRALETGAFVA